MRVNTFTGLLDARSDCRDCEFEQNGRNALALAARHADAHPDHTVDAEQTIGITYNQKPEPVHPSLFG